MTTFEDFWTLYPRKIAKRAAFKVWEREMKAGTAPDDILAGLRAQVPSLSARDPQFIPHAATWLNQGRWEDEVLPPAVRQMNGRTGHGLMDALLRSRAH